jgi:hypothetical protein
MNSEIKTFGKGGVLFAGPDAIELFRAATLKSALSLLKVGITPTRGLSGTKALAMVKRYTGETYKRGEFDRAIKDLIVWIETMKSAIPTTHEEKVK